MGSTKYAWCYLMASLAIICLGEVQPLDLIENDSGLNETRHDVSKLQQDVSDLANVMETLEQGFGELKQATTTTDAVHLKAFMAQKHAIDKRLSAFNQPNDELVTRIEEHEDLVEAVFAISDIQTQIQEHEEFVKDYFGIMEQEIKKIRMFTDSVTDYIREVDSVKTCPNNWHRHRDSCYYVSSEKANWETAKRHCAALGGFLIEYDDLDEIIYTSDIFIAITKWYDSDDDIFFVGASDKDREGDWRWATSGMPLEEGMTFWMSGQPDDDDRSEDCLTTRQYDNSQWNDVKCWDKFRYMCERHI